MYNNIKNINIKINFLSYITSLKIFNIRLKFKSTKILY